jgi:hypothetical protein
MNALPLDGVAALSLTLHTGRMRTPMFGKTPQSYRVPYEAPDPEYRPGNPDPMVARLLKKAPAVTHRFYPDQIAAMDPVLRYHLRLDPPEDGS